MKLYRELRPEITGFEPAEGEMPLALPCYALDFWEYKEDAQSEWRPFIFQGKPLRERAAITMPGSNLEILVKDLLYPDGLTYFNMQLGESNVVKREAFEEFKQLAQYFQDVNAGVALP